MFNGIIQGIIQGLFAAWFLTEIDINFYRICKDVLLQFFSFELNTSVYYFAFAVLGAISNLIYMVTKGLKKIWISKRLKVFIIGKLLLGVYKNI